MVMLIFIAAYIIVGLIFTRLMLRSFWTRAKMKNYQKSEFSGPAGYVSMLTAFNFLGWPVVGPINILLGASSNMDPENLQTQLKAKEKEIAQSRKYTNSLERELNLELTEW